MYIKVLRYTYEYINSPKFLNLEIINNEDLNKFYFHSLGYPEIPK